MVIPTYFQKFLSHIALFTMPAALCGANYYVSTSADSGQGSLRQVLADLNDTGGFSNTIYIPSDLGPIQLETALPPIHHNVSIMCPLSKLVHPDNKEPFYIYPGKTLMIGKIAIKAQEVKPPTKLSPKKQRKKIQEGLDLNASDSDIVYIDGSYQKGGSLIKTKRNTVVLAGKNDWGATQAEFQNGRLTVKGSLATSELVMKQGTFLNGTGIIDAKLLLEGTLEPGASIGTLILMGDQTFGNSSKLIIELDEKSTDLVHVIGALNILPGAVLTFDPMGLSPGEYTIIQATEGVTGAFSRIEYPTSYPALKFSLDYAAGRVSLLAKTAFVGQRPNTRQVAGALNDINAVSSADLASIIGQLVNLSSEQEIELALKQMSPSILKGLALTQQNDAIRVRMATDQRIYQVVTPVCAPTRAFNLWVDAIGNFYYQAKENDLNSFYGQNAGAMLGFDYAGFKNYFLGANLSYTHSHISWGEHAGYANIDSGFGGLYGGWYNSLFYADLIFQGSYNRYTPCRHIEFASINRKAKSHFSGNEFLAHLEWGTKLHALQMQINPFISTEYIYLHQNSFEENSAASLNLAVRSSDYHMIRSELGLNISHCFLLKKYNVGLGGKLSYIREDRFQGEKYTARFIDTENYFTSKGFNPDRNLFSPGISLGVFSHDGRLKISLKFDAELDDSYWDQNISTQINYAF